MDEVVEALEKYRGLVPLVYDIETMSLDEARPEDMQTAVYLKREADKVIAHHKYKRCLAMALRCKDKIDGMIQSEVKMPTYPYMCTIPTKCRTEYPFYERWHKRWRMLAEKFKPNSTASKENSDG